MITRRVSAIAILATALASCTQQPPPMLSIDPRVSVRGDAGVVVDQPLIVSTTRGGLTDVSIPLHGVVASDLAVQCAVDWLDAAGHPLGGLSAAPARVGIGAYATEPCRTVSPNPAARNFRVVITPSF